MTKQELEEVLNCDSQLNVNGLGSNGEFELYSQDGKISVKCNIEDFVSLLGKLHYQYEDSDISMLITE